MITDRSKGAFIKTKGAYIKTLLIFFLLLSIFLISTEGIYAKKEDQPLVSMIFFENDLRESLNEIALQTGVNIIMDETVNGLITADLEDVPLEKALRIILMGGGYSYRKIDDFYFVGLADPGNRTFSELSETEIVKLKYIKGHEVFNVLPVYLTDYVQGDRNSNLLSITAPVEETERIKKIINEIDKPARQIEVKILVTEIDSEEIKELGVNLFEYSNQGNENSFQFGLENNLLILETEMYGRILTHLNMLEKEEKAEINADPRIMVADGESAELFIGDRQILLIESGSEESSSRIERLEAGVGVELSAEIVGEDEVILSLAPEISHYIDNQRPDIVIKQNSLSTTLRVKDGQTIALAGMTLKGETFHSQRTPGLSDIPLLRWLFRHDTEKKLNRELLVFVTPVIH